MVPKAVMVTGVPGLGGHAGGREGGGGVKDGYVGVRGEQGGVQT